MRSYLWSLFAIVLLSWGVMPIQAATHTVSNQIELDGAIVIANNNAGADTIVLANDINLTIPLTNITDDLTILGNGYSIDGGLSVDASIFSIGSNSTITPDVTLNNITIRGGRGDTDTRGGLILFSFTCLTNQYNCGGGINIRSGNVTIIDSVIENNNTNNAPTKDGFGGGIYLNEGTLNLIGTRIEGNVASLNGAGLRTAVGTTTIIRNSVFLNNTAFGTNGDGGAIYNQGMMTITDSTFSLNEMRNGGAIANHGTLTIERSTIVGNLAYDNGGGLYNFNGGTTTLRNTTLDANFVGGDDGSHIYNDGTLNLEHVTIEAFAIFGDASDIALYHHNGTLNMTNTLISASQTLGGTTSTSCAINSGTFATNINNLIEDGTCLPSLSVAPGLVDTDLSDPDPAETADNGGPTDTIALLATSQAIDAGASGSCLPTDQRGVPRTAATCDIGAFEYTSVAAPVPSVTVGSASATNVDEGASVTIPVTVANLASGQIQVNTVIEGGTATRTDDYTLTDVLTFTTNGTQNITLDALSDAITDVDETVLVSFALVGTADITGNGTQTVTINDQPIPPTFSKVFAPDIINLGDVSTLTYTIDNSAYSLPATSLNFTHHLPTGMVFATPTNLGINNCTGGPLSASGGGSTLTFTGGTVSANATCTIQVDVTTNTSGDFISTTGDLTSSLGNSGTAMDTLTVTGPPIFSKVFAPASINSGDVSTLTYTIDNTASPVNATALDFTNNLPAGIVVAAPANASTTCTGGTLTATSSSSVITYTGGTVSANATCTIQVDVTATNTPGDFISTTGDLTSSLGNSGTATDTLTITDPAGTPPRLYPMQDAILDATTYDGPNFRFRHVEGTEWYRVWIGKTDGTRYFDQALFKWFDASIICDAQTDVCTIPDDLWLTNGDYAWWMTRWSENDPNFGQKWDQSTFSVNFAAPATTVTMSSPADGATVTQSPSTISWERDANVHWYRVWFGPVDYSQGAVYAGWVDATDPQFCDATTCTIDVDENAITAGEYHVYFQVWGPNGFYKWGGVNGGNPQTFTVGSTE